MNFKVEQMDRATIFRPKEARLDSLIAPDLKAEFLILSQPDVETLVLDLSEVQYVDSAGLSAMLLARRQQVSHEGDIRIVGASNDVRSLLELTQLDRVFPVYDTIEEALAAPQLSLITVSPNGVTPSSESLKGGMKIAAASIGAAAIADLMLSDGGFGLNGDDDLLDDDDDDFDDDLDDEDIIDDDENDDVIEEETIEEVDEVDDPNEADIEEIEEDDLLEADDLDLDDDEEDEDDDDLY